MRIVERRENFNIVEFGDRLYGIPFYLGPVDLAATAAAESEDIVNGRSADDVARQMDAVLAQRLELYSSTPLTVFGRPEVVEIEPVHNCNLRCVMCHVSYETLSNTRLDLAFLDNLSGLRGKWAKVGHLYEPMAHPQFPEILAGLNERGLKIDLMTNGSLLTDRAIEQTSRANLRLVTISFDGARKETYERIRRHGNFDQTFERIKAMKAAVLEHNPQCKFAVNYTVLRSNIEEIPAAVDMWEAVGFDHLGFIAMVQRSDVELLRRESLEDALPELRAALAEARRRVLDGAYAITLSSPIYRDPEIHPAADGLVVSGNPTARTPTTPGSHFQNGAYPGMSVDCRSPFRRCE